MPLSVTAILTNMKIISSDVLNLCDPAFTALTATRTNNMNVIVSVKGE